jgi:hypothetical protein
MRCEFVIVRNKRTGVELGRFLADEVMFGSTAQPASGEQERGKWRVGRKIALNVYDGDRPACQCHTALDAQLIVRAMNATAPRQSPTAISAPPNTQYHVGIPYPPNTDSELESANRNLANALGIADPAQRIGVYDYNSLVDCLRSNFETALPGWVSNDPQNMIQLMVAEIQELRRQLWGKNA